MTGRVITIELRGTTRQIAYTASNTQPEAFLWWSVDLPHDEALVSADRGEIEAACLSDLRERRADWRTQLLRRRVGLEYRRRRLP
jgi:hypothetical protein